MLTFCTHVYYHGVDEWASHTDALARAAADCQLPWREMPSPLSSSVSRTVEFGAEDEDVGSVCLGWSGLGDAAGGGQQRDEVQGRESSQ